MSSPSTREPTPPVAGEIFVTETMAELYLQQGHSKTAIEVLRTDTPLFARYVESRRNRRDDWYVMPAGHTDVCNISIPVR